MSEQIVVTYSLASGIPGARATGPTLNINVPGTGAHLGTFTPSAGFDRTDLGYHQAIHYVDSSGNRFVVEGHPAEEFPGY